MHRQRAAGVRRKGCGDAARPRQSLAGAAPHLEGAEYSGLAKGGVAASSAATAMRREKFCLVNFSVPENLAPIAKKVQ